MKKYIYIFSFMILLMIALYTATSFKHQSFTMTVTATETPILASETNEQIGTFKQGFEATVAPDQCTDWCTFSIGEQTGKIAISDVTLQRKTEPLVQIVEATQESIVLSKESILYKDASVTAEQLGSLQPGTALTVTSINNGWAKITLLNETAYIQLYEPFAETEAQSEQGIQTITTATLYLDEKLTTAVAQLAPAQTIAYDEEQATTYTTTIGDAIVYINKKDVEQTSAVTLKTTTQQGLLGSITVPKPTNTFVQNDSESAVLATLLPNYRYPLIAQLDGWYVLAIGDTLAYVPQQQAQQSKGVPVLVYHHILKEEQLGTFKNNSSTVTAEAFAEQMHYLANEQFTTLTTKQLSAYVRGQLIVPTNAVMITFDDGLLSTKEYAYPVLKQHGFHAIQHIISARKDRYDGFQTFDPTTAQQYFTDEEMAAQADVWGYEAHSFNMHILIPETQTSRLYEASPGELRDDLRQNLEDVPGAIAFAYPFGQYKEESIDVLKELGFQLAFTIDSGYAKIGDDPFRIKRFAPTQQTTLEDFVEYVEGR